MRKTAMGGLVGVARDPSWGATILNALLGAITDPALAAVERRARCRAGHDYAYDALWQLAPVRSSIDRRGN